MDDGTSTFIARSRRVRGALMVFCAMVLFLAGLLLLLAPAVTKDSHFRILTIDFASGGNGWIMSAHSDEPGPLG